ncbi:hypothetical protein Rsub_13137 [Raphidocelis subcapitata]|uniref:Uncharacterized protein n=1 Tax=Raphidocelis subcapitata TaxID=307507 RepID=A0A2V0PKQ8_9CHLO|nr:hypothetical protein Rsub_13137 [Raphidocelis subcapitata]|eukprot:GBG00385.1 hypothetical protein Rsub_13137 [Raphidocelis subcapitata]
MQHGTTAAVAMLQHPARRAAAAGPACSQRRPFCGGPRTRPRGGPVVPRAAESLAFATDSFSLLMKPETAAILSTAIAALSAVVGASLAEEKKAKLEKELEKERRMRLEMNQVASTVGRYRGPLLEASVDLEQRFWHALTRTGEWTPGADALCFEEVTYTLFTLAQLLGFMEVCRREGPRETMFLDEGSLAGSDTLFTLIEGMRFVMCASPATLQAWGCEGDERDHPGARERKFMMLRASDDCCAASASSVPLRISRGLQRAIGAMMVTTPAGAKRHYTMSYADFANRLQTDPSFAAWFQPIEEALADLLTGPCWDGETVFPVGRWSRVLLMQQLLVETFDLLDPLCLRLGASRRMRLAPVAYKPLPNLEAYRARLVALSGATNGTREWGELANLADPLAVATRARAAAATSNGSSSPGGPRSPASGLGSSAAVPQIEMPDIGAALRNAADEIRARAVGGNGNGSSAPAVGAASRAGTGTAEPVLPLSSVEQQMRCPNEDGGALMQGVIASTMLQRLQQLQTAQAAVAVAAHQQAQQRVQQSQDEAQEAGREGDARVGSGVAPAPSGSRHAAALSSANPRE